MPSAFILRSINWTYGFNPAGEGGDIKQYPPGQMELFLEENILPLINIYLNTLFENHFSKLTFQNLLFEIQF